MDGTLERILDWRFWPSILTAMMSVFFALSSFLVMLEPTEQNQLLADRLYTAQLEGVSRGAVMLAIITIVSMVIRIARRANPGSARPWVVFSLIFSILMFLAGALDLARTTANPSYQATDMYKAFFVTLGLTILGLFVVNAELREGTSSGQLGADEDHHRPIRANDV